MKKRKWILFILVLTMVATNIYYADNNSLDIVGMTSKIFEHSPAIKSGTLSVKNAVNQPSGLQGASAAYALATATNSSVIYAIKIAPLLSGYLVNAKERGFEVAQNTMRVQCYTLYINLLKSQYAVDLQNQLAVNAEKSYKDSQLKYNKGQISRNDLKLSEQNWSKAKLSLQISERKSKGLLMTLNAMMGEPVNKQYDHYIDNNIIPTTEIASVDEYIKLALESRVEVINAVDYLPIKEKESEITRTDHIFSDDIYFEETKYNIDKAKTDIDQAKVAVEISVVNYYKILESKMAVWESAEEQFKLAESNYNSAQQKFKLGKLSEAMMNMEKVTYMSAKMTRDNAKLDAFLAQIKMSSISGAGPAN